MISNQVEMPKFQDFLAAMYKPVGIQHRAQDSQANDGPLSEGPVALPVHLPQLLHLSQLPENKIEDIEDETDLHDHDEGPGRLVVVEETDDIDPGIGQNPATRDELRYQGRDAEQIKLQ